MYPNTNGILKTNELKLVFVAVLQPSVSHV